MYIALAVTAMFSATFSLRAGLGLRHGNLYIATILHLLDLRKFFFHSVTKTELFKTELAWGTVPIY